MSPEKRTIDADRLLAFLEGWRGRLLAIDVETLPAEQFGQVVTLNTIISYVSDAVKRPAP